MPLARILIVDDDDLILRALNEVLEYEGFEVSSAGNVADALKLISANVYDVVLSDLHMPGAGDGDLTMTGGFQVHRPMLFVVPIMILLVMIQLIAMRRRKRGLDAKEWPKVACIVLLVALGTVAVFTNFR